HRNRRTGLTEVEDDGALGLFFRGIRDAAAVVADRRAHAVGARGGEPGDGAAEATADHAHLEPGLLQLLDGGLHVHYRLVGAELAPRGSTALDVLRAVP